MNSKTILIGVFCWSCLLMAASQAVDLTVSVGNSSGGKDSTVTVPIVAKGGPQVEAGRVVLSYDPAMLEVEDVILGAAAKAGKAMGGFTVNEPGRVTMNFVSTDGVAGEGEWFVVQFKVTGSQGQSCPLELQKIVSFRFDNRVDILATAENGTFTIGSPMPWMMIAFLGGGLFLALVTAKLIWRPARQTTPSAASPATSVYCSACGTANGAQNSFCTGCGNQLAGQTPAV